MDILAFAIKLIETSPLLYMKFAGSNLARNIN